VVDVDDPGATDAQAGSSRSDRRRRGRSGRPLPTWLVLLIALLISVLVRVFLVGIYAIPTGSMENTLALGDRVAVAKWRGGDVRRGDVVVFDGATTWGPVAGVAPGPLERAIGDVEGHDPANVYIKRVVGVGGDRVTCCDAQHRLTVNGSALAEPYVYPGDEPSQTPFDVQVPAGRVWLMGDHRAHSADSRFHTASPGGGTVSVDDIIGPVLFRYWPLSGIGSLD
jgi:signal peptidase I